MPCAMTSEVIAIIMTTSGDAMTRGIENLRQKQEVNR